MLKISKAGRLVLAKCLCQCPSYQFTLYTEEVKAVPFFYNHAGVLSVIQAIGNVRDLHLTARHKSKHIPSSDSSHGNREPENEATSESAGDAHSRYVSRGSSELQSKAPPAESTRGDVRPFDISQLGHEDKKSVIPPHDVTRLTSVGWKLEVKADLIFDQLAALKGYNPDTFLTAVQTYISQESLYRRGAVEFIYTGLAKMKQFGVEKDMVAYKALIQVFPEGKMIPRNIWQVEFMHYPRHQQCGIDLLEMMENNKIIPDDEFGRLLQNRFGSAAHVTRKYKRMKYWMPKFKNANPYPIPFQLPKDPTELAILALKRMCVDPDTQYSIFKTMEMDVVPEEDTFIASAQSPTQQQLISKHKPEEPLMVEGPYPVYLRACFQQYFLLRAEPDISVLLKERQRQRNEESDEKLFEWKSYFDEEQCSDIRPILSVHEQEDCTVLGLCITGTRTKSSLVSWIRCLEKSNPVLAKTPVLFKLMSSDSEIEAVGDNRSYKKQ